MKGLKKIIAAVMVVCMMGVVLAGCGGSKDETTGATEATTAAVETDGTKEEASDPTKENTEAKTEAKTEAEDADVEAGTNMSDAAQIGLEQEVSGTVESAGAAWYSFTTGPADKMNYKVLLVNTSADDADAVIEGAVCYVSAVACVVGMKNVYSNHLVALKKTGGSCLAFEKLVSFCFCKRYILRKAVLLLNNLVPDCGCVFQIFFFIRNDFVIFVLGQL